MASKGLMSVIFSYSYITVKAFIVTPQTTAGARLPGKDGSRRSCPRWRWRRVARGHGRRSARRSSHGLHRQQHGRRSVLQEPAPDCPTTTCSDIGMMSSNADGRFVHKDGTLYPEP